MAILTGPGIREAVHSAELLIDPFDDGSVESATYDARLFQRILISPTRLEPGRELDLRNEPDEGYGVQPGRFVGVLTREIFKMPLNLAARFGLKSTFTRRGLVAFGGIQIDPGFHGRLAVSLFNAGPEPIQLTRSERMFTIEFNTLDRRLREGEGYQGEFQDQLDFHHSQREFILNAQTVSLSEIGSLPSEVAQLRQQILLLQTPADQTRRRGDLSPAEALKELVAAHPEKRITNPRSLMGEWPGGDGDLDAFLSELEGSDRDLEE